MSFLLDTCILSKSRKLSVSHYDKLRKWLTTYPESSYFISAVSIGEIQSGISKLKREEHTKKMILENWLLSELIPRFADRILGIDQHTCLLWGRLMGEAQNKGRPLPVIDTLIAASALQHQLVLVTDNIKDFQDTDVPLFNPLI